jgi:oligopeptide/dipeptide ABC transporter ATP-binding protein
VDFELRRGECFALVGESGSGKSMTALSILRLLPEAGRIADGKVLLQDQDLLALPEAAMRAVRGRRVAMIFQEPATALNPVLTVGRQIMEVIERHTGLAGDAARRRALELLEAVGIPDAVRRFEEYAFQLSGGLKQRVMIAAALGAEPDVLIADEPTTALDVTIQAQILDLIRALRRDTGTAVVLITHDLGVVAEMADRVAVMYGGQIVEEADVYSLFADAKHPYTRGLLGSIPKLGRHQDELSVIPGRVPTLIDPAPGCRFADRCPDRMERCSVATPSLVDLADGRRVRCFLYSDATVEETTTPIRVGRH